jgi:osmotically-inducible protein OsmY
MTTASLTPTDLRLRDSVVQQLSWDSQVDASDIGVAAHHGVVTLTGFVGTYAEKLEAERAAKRVRGVRAVANDVNVRLRLPRTDVEIAGDAARALTLRATLPESVQAVVRNGHITLTGTVPTLFQRVVAEKAVRHVKGVMGVINHIAVVAPTSAKDIKRNIIIALHRDADVDARKIDVTVTGNTVVLSGEVASWHERDAAEKAAMHAPGITHVENLVSVAPPDIEESDLDDLC